jgi:hypothetical protein
VVFLWWDCGELCGKHGSLTDLFRGSKNRTGFAVFF